MIAYSLACQRQPSLRVADRPPPHCHVVETDRNNMRVGGERNSRTTLLLFATRFPLRGFEGIAQWCTLLTVPQLYGNIGTHTNNIFSIRAEGDGGDRLVVASQNFWRALAASLKVPQPHDPVITATDDRVAIRADRQWKDHSLLLPWFSEGCALPVPQAHDPVAT